MVFNLTEKLANEIVQALENQEQTFMVRAENSTLVPFDSASLDEHIFYSLPEWDSKNGFELRESFVRKLHSPIAKEELQRILYSGRGVFKNFKNELKNYPEVEKLWHRYKNKKMLELINNWYNSLREVWGLEKLEKELEETSGLVEEDFTFCQYTQNHKNEIIKNLYSAAFFGQSEDDIPQAISETVFDIWRKQFDNGENNEQTGIICHSLLNEFAGCITSAPVSKRTEKVVVITSFFVPLKFRGLGIGTQLLTSYLSLLRTLNKKWILLAFTAIPDSLQALLLHFGFKKTDSGFLAEIK